MLKEGILMGFRQDHCSPPDYDEDENDAWFPEKERDYWYSEAERYHAAETLERYEEARRRNAETTRRMFSIYCSYRVAGILLADIVLSLLLFPRQYFIVGLIGSNFLVFVLVLFCCYNISKTRVQPETREKNSAILLSAHDSASRRY